MRRFVLLLALLASACQQSSPANRQDNAPAASAPRTGAKLDRSHAGAALPDLVIKDPDGEDMSMSELGGKPVLVNLWATWCAPCIKELPTLDALAREPGAPSVVAVSQDMEPQPVVADFLARNHIGKLEAYQDSENRLMGELKVEVLPTTILYDSTGREVWRYTGENDWKSSAAKALLAEAK
ncbi:TlpA family protein disulfide reductase [Sphingomonas ginkgonis]|uniref:TlpA family protein disulfide reductase n=1 Tax=Sphingomonas ginkgonis TaxID=2315330 RepID=A0A429V6S7_9SPHN|nr:TlpA disulfide reductase family protein [Sphingomonas ginkgonis]RST29643.1 TlpA family protein disulfide reductase [Sphingomonas ginkgonis]